MGKTGRWIRNLFTGKRDNNREASIASPINSGGGGGDPRPKEKRRWSFRRPSPRPETDPTFAKKHALAVATAAAADAAVAAAKAAAVVIQLTAAASGRAEEAAAIKIQCVFRGYLARKALNALRGLVKLQALVRGHLVRKQATATLRCMQALITVQARARAHRIRMAAEAKSFDHNPRKSTQDYDKGIEENIKIVEMDLGNSYKPATKARNSYSNQISSHRSSIRQEKISPVPSAIADSSPRTCSNHFDEYSFRTAQCYSATSKPDLTRTPFSYARSEYGESAYDEFPFFPNYMANTESSRAKVRSHSAPKSRPADAFDRQSSRRGHLGEGRNVPRGVRMQRSSSQVSSTGQNYQFLKLDKSINESECGSTSTYRSVFGYEVQGHRF